MTTTIETPHRAGTAPLKLDHLPVIAQAFRRLKIAELVDERVPRHARSLVSAGECVEALIATILLGSHTLYRVDQVLAPYDLETAFGWTFEPARFHDERLAKALDALHASGLGAINAAAAVRAISEYQLDLSVVHFDTTSLSVHGAYATSIAPADPEDPSAVPHLTHGHSKDHRPDLKQVMFGLTVTSDGAVPLTGRATSGNRADSLEARFEVARLAKVLPDPRSITLVGDSKFFAGETLLLARRFAFDFVTLMPRSVGLWADVFSAFKEARARGPLPVLKEEVSDRRDGGVHRWRGTSFDRVYEFKDERGVVTPIPLRLIVVESTQLAALKRKTLERARRRERLAIERAIKKLRKRSFRCAPDAEEARARLAEALAPRFHKLQPMVTLEFRKTKRARPGRPRNDEAPLPEKQFWHPWFEVTQDDDAFAEILLSESCFVLATSLAREGPNAKTDVFVFDAYQEQWSVEGALHWLKGPLELAPIFLKTPRRVAALGLVYVLALMVYALIQRDARRRLAAASARIPGNLGWTATPTTEVVFRLFEGVSTTRSPRRSGVSVENLTTEQVRALELLGIDLLRRPEVRTVRPRTPRPGERGYRPPGAAVGVRGRR